MVAAYDRASVALHFTCKPSPLPWRTPLFDLKRALNAEIKRRTDVVGVLPNPAALLRLAEDVLVKAHDEWQVSNRRYPRGLHSPAQPER